MLAAFGISNAAFAQTSVTVYGIVDLGFVSESGGAAGSVSKLSSGAQSGSRIGFRGTEDLGGGLKALFTAETGFCADTNAGAPNFCTGGNNFMGRQAWVAIDGSFGRVSLGRQYTVAYNVLNAIDPWGVGLAGQSSNLIDEGKANRVNNAVIYSSPNLSGFTGSLQYAFGEVVGSTSGSRMIGLAGTYSSGPVYVGLGMSRYNTAAGLTGKKTVLFGGTYDFGIAKAHLLYNKVQNGAATATTSYADANDLLVGASAPVGPGTLLVSYVRHNDRLATNKDGNQFGIGYLYYLSKRTNLYAAYARMNNSTGAFYLVGNATDTGTGNRAFNLGVRHSF